MLRNYSSRFPEGSNNRKSNNDVKHDHGQEKRRPSTYVEGKIYTLFEYPRWKEQTRN